MTTREAPEASPAALTTVAAAVVLAGFGAFSAWVVATRGYLGFLDSARRDVWSLQVLIDLGIAAWFAVGWMRGDARKRGIAIWPYVALTVAGGSIGLLVYCVRRSFAPQRAR